MLFQTHLALGVITFILFGDYFSGGNVLLFFFFVLLGSLLPDLDDGKSKIKQASGILGMLISFIFKHRGFLHSLFFGALLWFVVSFWSTYYAWGLLLGFFSHLFGDVITVRGLRLFYPFNFRIHGWLRVGSFWEMLVLFIALVLLVRWLVIVLV